MERAMSLNSSTPNVSLPNPAIFYLAKMSLIEKCYRSKTGIISITAYSVSSILLLLPLYILVFYLGSKRWKQRGSRVAVSHSEFFTYHMVLIDLISIVGSTLSSCGALANLLTMQMLGLHLLSINMLGQVLLHILTCVERYLAVVHPITYLSLRKEKWIKIRNITIGCVWILCSGSSGFMQIQNHNVLLIINFFTTVFPLLIISFCSISVACVLYRPGPGEGGVSRQRVDQSKLRAFYTILAILGVLLFRMVWTFIVGALYDSPLIGDDGKCGIMLSVAWFTLPSSLVLPLLFLQKEGKLQCCKIRNESTEVQDLRTGHKH